VSPFGLDLASGSSYRIIDSYEGIPWYLLQNPAGYSIVSSGLGSEEHWYLSHNGTLDEIGTLGGSKTVPMAVNSLGQVVGLSYLAGDEVKHACLYYSGAVTDLGTLGGRNSSAYLINDHGDAAGTSYIAGDQFQHAFVYQNGPMRDLGTLGGNSSYAFAMNNSGRVVGTSFTSDGYSHAFLWDDGLMTDLRVLGNSSVSSVAVGINSSGQIVGNCYSENVQPVTTEVFGGVVIDGGNPLSSVPFLYTDGVMEDINSLVVGPHIPFDHALSIDDTGQIIVHGRDMIDWGLYRDYTLVLSPVPEPSTYALLACSLVAIAAMTRSSRWCSAAEAQSRKGIARC
jgi:probable HAF family extracellular repeat protein